jgi:hypothetical protein
MALRESRRGQPYDVPKSLIFVMEAPILNKKDGPELKAIVVPLTPYKEPQNWFESLNSIFVDGVTLAPESA